MKKDLLHYRANLLGAVVLCYLACSFLLKAGLDGILSLWLEGAGVDNPVGLSELTVQLLNLGLRALGFLFPFLFLWKLEPELIGRLSLKKPPRGVLAHALPVFLLFTALCTALTGALAALFPRLAPANAAALPESGAALAVSFISTCLLSPFAEEVLFRGGLQSLLRPWGDRFAIIVTALVFALLHPQPVQLPAIFLMSLFLGAAACSSGGLCLSILLHFANNCSSFLLLLTRHRLDGTSALGFTVLLFFVYLCCGVPALVLTVRRKRIEKLAPPPAGLKKGPRRTVRLLRAPFFTAALVWPAVLLVLEFFGI